VALAQWTGREARALRRALRLSVRRFAEHLDVGVRTVTKWESLAERTTPRPDSQALLDAALALADADTRKRFELLLAAGPARAGVLADPSPREWDYETWSDDLSRAAICGARQDFMFGTSLVDRWLRRFSPDALDAAGLYLRGRSLALLGDLQRDQGLIRGPLSAGQTYRRAWRIFHDLGMPRRVAQLDLALAVVEEMSGNVEPAAARYQVLSGDDRLDARDRARARLWLGTALSKKRHHDPALRAMSMAIREFEAIEEPEEWSVAHQKLALAHRGAGDLTSAAQWIDVALSHRTPDSPLQRVRLDTAHAHILLSDPQTARNGLALLDQAIRVASTFGLTHQLGSIDTIRAAYDRSSS
jgi:hypothetical protein